MKPRCPIPGWNFKEPGGYGRDNTPGQRTAYIRGGWLDHIDYGMRAGTEYTQTAPLRVAFTTAERCLSACWSGANWASSPRTANWPDTPLGPGLYVRTVWGSADLPDLLVDPPADHSHH
jgi:hypothetical protein